MAPSMVSEVLLLKIRMACMEIENLNLRSQQINQQGPAVQARRDSLIEEARREVGAAPGQVLNLDTGVFQDAPGGGPT